MTEWISKPQKDDAKALIVRGKTIPRAVVRILQNRGYHDATSIEGYFAPSLDQLHDPFLLCDMERAADRLMRAISNKERVLVHGDYDTDGITACAMIVSALKHQGIEAEYYIPHRIEEGYGLSMSGVAYAQEKGCTLLITVDCGITALDEVSHARNCGIDVIITDHHKPPAELPRDCLIINPKRSDDPYPFKELAGIGVAFKLVQALFDKLQMPRESAHEYLDLVALGTVVDVVPLIDENRIFVKHGLHRILKSRNPGIRALLEETGLQKGVTAYHLGFVIGPRINACGRVSDARAALELLLTSDKEKAARLAHMLSTDNKKRQAIEDQILKDAVVRVTEGRFDEDRVLVLADAAWHEGIVGIVASRVSDQFQKPAVLLTLKQTSAKGSARSVPGFDITDALRTCHDLLSKYGGHSQAAGLELDRSKIPQLRRRLNEHARGVEPGVFEKKYTYDIELSFEEITKDVLHFLKYFEPTGVANPQPVFLGCGLEIVGVPRVVGSDHLKFALRSNDCAFEAIAYGKGQMILDIEVGKTRVDCLYSISEDSFFRKKKVVIKIKDIKKV